jgi:hypothetical protein
MAALFAFTGSQIMSNLLSVKSMRVEVCVWGPCRSLTIEYVVSRAWYIGCALGFQPREEISIISVRSKFRGCGLLAGHRAASPNNRVRFSASAPYVKFM